jgi:hypothetical protein
MRTSSIKITNAFRCKLKGQVPCNIELSPWLASKPNRPTIGISSNPQAVINSVASYFGLQGAHGAGLSAEQSNAITGVAETTKPTAMTAAISLISLAIVRFPIEIKEVTNF